MTIRTSEAIVLRTWPFHEADVLVSLFTRDYGKVRGVAKSGAKSHKRFGGALEPMTRVRSSYSEKGRQEIVRLNSFETLWSPLAEPVDYGRVAALSLFAEVLEDALPEHDPQDAMFRLAASTAEQALAGRCWLPVVYFSLWMSRLMGWLPSLETCIACGRSLAGSAAYFHALTEGLFCGEHRRATYSELSPASVRDAHQILRQPITALSCEQWPRARAADLRRFAVLTLERHLERKLVTAAALARIPA
ncbi:MAG TPA: DNA repair protein RecO [Acidobacteriaceae bacterium]|nr:DNA repair protein RecO [Acidobacteriaceae bacterium]